MASPSRSIRPATEADIPAMLSLLLTSFRQFSLFSFLYSPLNTNKDSAVDTIWVWRRRLLLGLLDPSTSIIVAEVGDDEPATVTKSEWIGRIGGTGQQSVVEESWRMLEWVEARGTLSQRSSTGKGRIIVGFAIWKVRLGEKAGKNVVVEEQKGFIDALRTAAINAEIWLWNKVWTRKDQNLAAYASYLESEEELGEQFYPDTCYYLDNVCVDFRYQRLGIGSALVRWGLVIAKTKGLPVMTEAGPMGLDMYLKLGFTRIGTWKVPTKGGEEDFMEFPVLNLKGSDNSYMSG